MKTAAIYNPYWDTLGGGEKYVAAACSSLIQNGYSVDILWHEQKLIEKILSRFNLDISQAKVSKNGYSAIKTNSLIDKNRYLSKYNLVFWVSDGSIPAILGSRNILLLQAPFVKKEDRIKDYLKIKLWHKVLAYSKFTKTINDKTFHTNCVIVPPLSTMMPSEKKQKIILSVGRFDSNLHSKRHDIVIKAFDTFKPKGWDLILAGGAIDLNVVEELKKQTNNEHIWIIANPNYQEIENLYSVSSIYWHAAGYGADLKNHPEKAEHFGISTVESMSAGSIPIVFNGGGQTEIVRHGHTGFLWNTFQELIDITKRIINSESDLIKIRHQAQSRAHDFDAKGFHHAFSQAIS